MRSRERASERTSHRKRSSKTGDTPIGRHGENSEITDIACGNKPSLECREGGCAFRVSPTETKEQPLGGGRRALISRCIFGRVAILCTRQNLVVHRQIPRSISRHPKQAKIKQTREREKERGKGGIFIFSIMSNYIEYTYSRIRYVPTPRIGIGAATSIHGWRIGEWSDTASSVNNANANALSSFSLKVI